MIAVGGFKVFPSQVEAILYQHEAVKAALVIGIPDAYAGERPKAFVTLQEGTAATGEEVLDWLNRSTGKPERVVACEVRLHLPQTTIGKLSSTDLQDEQRARAGE